MNALGINETIDRVKDVSRFVGLCEGLCESGEPTVNPSAVPQDQFSVQGRRVDLGVNSSSPKGHCLWE